MHGKVTDQEWLIFKDAYRFFEAHCNPPANQDEQAVPWWMKAGDDLNAIDNAWNDHPLMRELLMAVFTYIECKAKEKTEQANKSEDFAHEEPVQKR